MTSNEKEILSSQMAGTSDYLKLLLLIYLWHFKIVPPLFQMNGAGRGWISV